MKKLLLFLIIFTTYISVSAQNVSINGNKFYVGTDQIWFNGINTPWHLFDDFGRSDFSATWWEEEFQKYADNKINLARIWIHGSGEISPDITEDGLVTGANDLFWAHMDKLFEISRDKEVYIMPCLFSFDMTKSSYPTYQRYRNMLASEANVQSYIDNVLIPLVKKYNNEPYLLGWEICNEPEWMFENTEHGPQTLVNVQRLHAMMAAAIHKNCENFVTTGSAAPKWNSDIYDNWGDREGDCWSSASLQSVYNDADAYLDFYQYHWYPWQSEYMASPFTQTTVEYGVDFLPVIVGESEGNYVCDDYICQTVSEMYESAYLNGFDGVCAWKTPQNDGHGTFDNIKVATNEFYNNHAALVYPGSGTNTPVTGVSVSPSEDEIYIGASVTLNHSILPGNASDKSVTWSTSDASIASVSNKGVVTGIAEGIASITVTTTDGGFKATASITVIESTTPCIDPEEITIPLTYNGAGEFCWLTSGTINYINSWNMTSVEINGVDYTNKWSNSMPERINGNYYIHYKATVSYAHIEINGIGGTSDIPVTGITVAPTTATISSIGGTATLTSTVAPSNATNKSVTWSSSNTAVATVNNSGVVTAVANGNATITVTTVDGSFTAISAVTVDVTTTIPVTGVSVTPTSATIISTGGTVVLTATVTPSNASNKSVTWSSSNTAAATVNSSGVVTAIANGDAIITVTSVDGSYTATSAITVEVGSNPEPCDNPVSISIPFAKDGAGEFCYATSQEIAYVNAWNMDLVEINGVDFTNKWSNSLPASIDGKWYIYYKASVAWAHFEAPAVKRAEEISETTNNVHIYPNPFNNEVSIELNGLKDINTIEIYNALGQYIQSVDKSLIKNNLININIGNEGKMFILRIHTEDQVIVRQLIRQ